MEEVLQNSNVNIMAPQFHRKQTREGVNTLQLFIGLHIFILGVLFYYLFRTAEHTYFLRFFTSNAYVNGFKSPMFVIIGDGLPTFIQVFAFTLMTAAIIASRKRGYLTVYLSWFAIDVLFKIGQAFGNSVAQIITLWFSNFFFLENKRNYFLHGWFD